MAQDDRKSRFIGELMAQQPPPRDYICGEWLIAGSANLLWAPTGTGKSRFAMGLAHALATGQEFLGWPVKKARRVGYIDGEMGTPELFDRFWRIENASSVEIKGDGMRVITYEDCGGQVWDVASREGQELYTKEFADCDVLIIDNLLTCARMADRHDDEVRQWQRIQSWIIREREKGKAIILIHHANKSGAGQLGTVTREAMLNTVLSLRPVYFGHVLGTAFALSFEKHRHFTGSDPIYIEFIDDIWRWQPLIDKARHYLLGSKKRLSPVAIATATGVDLRTATVLSHDLQREKAAQEYKEATGDDDFDYEFKDDDLF